MTHKDHVEKVYAAARALFDAEAVTGQLWADLGLAIYGDSSRARKPPAFDLRSIRFSINSENYLEICSKVSS